MLHMFSEIGLYNLSSDYFLRNIVPVEHNRCVFLALKEHASISNTYNNNNLT